MMKVLAFFLLALLAGALALSPLLLERRKLFARLDGRLSGLSAVAAPAPVAARHIAMPERMAPLFARAQIELSSRAIGIVAGCGALAMLFMLLLAGPVATLAFVLAAPLLLLAWVQRRAARRIDALVDALPFYIDAVRQMQAVGASLSQALERALAESPAIVRAYLAPMARRLQLGAPAGEAMQQLAERLQVAELSMLAAAIRTSLRYGGSISTTLSNLSGILRERIRIKRELKAATSEARVSARVLVAMPLVAMALLMAMNPAYLDFFLDDPRGRRLAIIAMGLQVAGMLVMRRVMRLAF